MDISQVKDVDSFDRWMEERNLSGHWHREVAHDFRPCLWKWADIYTALVKSGDLITLDFTSRRDVHLVNPSIGRRRPSNTISAALQYLMPGDVASAHRHSPATARWLINGDPGAYSVVEGEPFACLEGDLITSPSMTWHDHYHKGEQPVIWLACLDSEITRLAHHFGQRFPETQQPIKRPEGYGGLVSRHARPSWIKSEFATPPHRYPWTDTWSTLQVLKESEEEGDPHDGIRVDFANADGGGPTFPTMSCAAQLLLPYQSTKAHRHNSTTIYQAFRGTGTTVIDGERFDWTQGDIFVIPPWTVHHHENSVGDDVVLYSISDWPAMVALGLYEEDNEPAESATSPRTAVGTISGR